MVSARPIIRFRDALRGLRIERMRLDERAAHAADHRVQAREDHRVAFLDAHHALAVELMHEPEERHQVRSILKPGGKVGTFAALCGLQSRHR